MQCIFIGGADRSGTTMLASLLSKIKDSVVTPESLFKTDIPFEYPISTSVYLDKVSNDQRFKRWNTDINSMQQKHYHSYDQVYQDILSLYAPNKNINYWIDHSPNNLMYSKLLNATFNDCYFIHIVRDGRAVAHSQIPLEWGENTFLQSSRAWLNKMLYGFITQALFPEKTIFIKYEDLLIDSEKEISKILSLLGNPELVGEQLNGDFVPDFSKEQHSLVGKTPDISRANAWQTKLSSQEVADFQYYASDALSLLGYELMDTGTTHVTRLHIIKEFLKEMWFKKVVNPGQYKLKRKQH